MTHIPDPLEAKKRMDTVSQLLIEQAASKRSRGVLLKLFQSYCAVMNERDRYRDQIGDRATQTVAWSHGYLQAASEAIDGYLHARWSVTGITTPQIELICHRRDLAKLFHEHGSQAETAVGGGTTDQGTLRA